MKLDLIQRKENVNLKIELKDFYLLYRNNDLLEEHYIISSKYQNSLISDIFK